MSEAVASHLRPVASFDVADHPMPTKRDEVWRFAPLEKLAPLLSDGRKTSSGVVMSPVPEGVVVSELTRDDLIARDVQAPFDRIAAVAFARATSIVHLDVPAGFGGGGQVGRTVSIDGGIAHGSTLVTVGANAQITIVTRHTGAGTYGEYTHLEVGPGARVTFVSIQDWAPGAVHGGQQSIHVGRDASVKMVTVSLGGDVVRLTQTARLDAPGGRVEQFGVGFVDAGQHIEHRLSVDHIAPHTSSNVDYRNVVQGEVRSDGMRETSGMAGTIGAGGGAAGRNITARSVWVGDVLIRKTAEDIETYEANKNLVLTDGCRVDSVPNLEIETGQIRGAGHSSATGRFDAEQLFYLCSRGIPEDEARRLVVSGFLADIVRRIGVPEVEDEVLASIEGKLAAPTTATTQE